MPTFTFLRKFSHGKYKHEQRKIGSIKKMGNTCFS